MPQATIMRPHCPHCGGATIHPRGSKQRPGRFQCADCKKYFVDRGSPKVLVFDIETLPIIGTFWDTGKQYIGHNNIMEDWVVLSWSAKSLFDSNTIGDILTPGEIKRRLNTVIDPNPDPHYADERIVRRMWKLIDEADVVIHQNGKKFDMRKLNARFVYYGLPPYRPVHQIDTLIAAQAAWNASGPLTMNCGQAQCMVILHRSRRCMTMASMTPQSWKNIMHEFGPGYLTIPTSQPIPIATWTPTMKFPAPSVATPFINPISTGRIEQPSAMNMTLSAARIVVRWDVRTRSAQVAPK
jgi:hypothetical protein